MSRQTAHDFHPEVLKLFDQFVHGGLSRRGFLDAAGRHAAAVGTTAAGLLAALSPRFAEAQQVSPQDARLKTSYLELPAPQGNGRLRGYMVAPAQAAGRLPTVLVIHENRGLNPHIEDIARRLALDGFIAFAPDGLFPLGGYPGDEDKARVLFPQLDQAKAREDFVAAFQHLKALPAGNGKVGAVGFCYGGSIVNFLATRLPELAGGVPYYGSQPASADAARIKSPLLIHYAGIDDRINAGAAAYETALKAAGVEHEALVYAGTQHGFNNDTTPRYDEAAAKLSWQRTVAFFRRTLRT